MKTQYTQMKQITDREYIQATIQFISTYELIGVEKIEVYSGKVYIEFIDGNWTICIKGELK